MSWRAQCGLFLMVVGMITWSAVVTIEPIELNPVPCYVLFLAGATLATHNDPPKEANR